MPPISIEHIDAANLLKSIEELRNEVATLSCCVKSQHETLTYMQTAGLYQTNQSGIVSTAPTLDLTCLWNASQAEMRTNLRVPTTILSILPQGRTYAGMVNTAANTQNPRNANQRYSSGENNTHQNRVDNDGFTEVIKHK